MTACAPSFAVLCGTNIFFFLGKQVQLIQITLQFSSLWEVPCSPDESKEQVRFGPWAQGFTPLIERDVKINLVGTSVENITTLRI